MSAHSQNTSATLRRVAVIGNHLPRRCGIATFTTDLVQGLRKLQDDVEFLVLPMNDRVTGYDYPEPVRFEIDDKNPESYRLAADFLNINNIDAVIVQHEYGIFGGAYGSYLVDLLDEIRMPVITTLHTVLEQPGHEQRQIARRIAERSYRVISMSRRGVAFLEQAYGIDPVKIACIPHGIHDVPFVDPNYYKDQFGVEGRQVLMTFGLLSPGKGIETAIRALPAVVEQHPQAVYLIVGATHPHVRAHEGENYRHSLQRLARELGVAGHVVFHDQFVELDELMEFIGATDIYLTPYPRREQITSGTLAYAAGAGKAVVSTPYWHAEELLAEGCGRLVPFGDPSAMAVAINDLLSHEPERHAMRKRAYTQGRICTWQRVAAQYMDLLRQARGEHHAGGSFSLSTLQESRPTLPELRLDALERMSDDTGLLQHARFTVPDRQHGYSIDDNARALILCTRLQAGERSLVATASRLADTYLAYIEHAWNPTAGRFRNFLGYDRRWLEEAGSEDSHARALYGLGVLLGEGEDLGRRQLATVLFEQALLAVREFTSPRAWAFTVLGVDAYLQRYAGDRALRNLTGELGERLFAAYGIYGQPGWRWFEPVLSYCNARLPQALLRAGIVADQPQWVDAALEALEWISELQVGPGGCFDPIGCQGWYPHGGERALFDQQPVEASNQIAAAFEAWRHTDDDSWHVQAQRAFDWFLGANRVGVSLYDPTTSGCRDGLHADRANENQGAESIVSWLLAQNDMLRFAEARRLRGLEETASPLSGM